MEINFSFLSRYLRFILVPVVMVWQVAPFRGFGEKLWIYVRLVAVNTPVLGK